MVHTRVIKPNLSCRPISDQKNKQGVSNEHTVKVRNQERSKRIIALLDEAIAISDRQRVAVTSR